MDLLDKLAKQKLKQPKGLRQFIYFNTSYQTRTMGRYACVETMEKWNGTWILRVFAYKQMPKNECTYQNIKVMEVQRSILGYKEYLSTMNAYNTAMGGRYILWDEDTEFFRCKKNWDYYGYKMFDTQEIINDLNVPYCSWEQYQSDCGRIRFIDYLSLYIKEPRIERLVKLGLSQYVHSLRYLDLGKHKIYDVFKLDKKWECAIGSLSMSDILILRKYSNQINELDEIDYYKKIYQCQWGYQHIKEWTASKPFRTIKYLREQNDIHSNGYLENIYDDYLRLAIKLGLDLERNKILYPDILMKAHDEVVDQHQHLQEELELAKTKEWESAFMQHYQKNKMHEYSESGLIITPVKSQLELIDESKKLRHCVRTYAEQIAKGQCEILFVRKEETPNEPYVTVEVKDKRITQARGKNNCVPSEEVKEFLMKWSQRNKLEYHF